jgi:Spy/CpxP family protein refolding chaperone
VTDSRAKLIGTLALVFGLGLLLGGLTMNLYHARAQADAAPGWSARRFDPARYLDQLSRELSLRPNQAEALRGILGETRGEFARLRQEVAPKYRAIRERARERIRAILDPEQRARFADINRRWDEERRLRGW